jgi:hypothetical protein
MKINFFNFFTPAIFIARFCFSYGGNSMGGQGDNKSSTATTDASTNTTVTTTNNQVGASEGSTAIGAGASVTVTSADPSIMIAALGSNNTAMKDALAFAGERGSSVDSLVSKLLDKNPTPSNETSNLLAGVSSVVASNMASATKTVETTSNKPLYIGLGVVVVVFGVALYLKTSN